MTVLMSYIFEVKLQVSADGISPVFIIVNFISFFFFIKLNALFKPLFYSEKIC